jgi:hypothetical protein
MHFNVTHEFEDFVLSDWLDNEKWFDVKLLVDPSGGEFKKPRSNNSYAKAIKVILFALAIMAYHLVHLGRNLGPKILEMLEEESDCIRQLDNWNPFHAGFLLFYKATNEANPQACRVRFSQWDALQSTYNGGSARGACEAHSHRSLGT